MTNEQLVTLIQAGRDVADNMLALWQQNQGLIAKIALSYSGYEELDDLKQQGYIGLCKSVDGYRASEGVPFANYAAIWIRQSMVRYIEDCGGVIRLPNGTRSLLVRYRRFNAAMLAGYGREASDDEARCYLGISKSTMERLHQAELADKVKSIDAQISDDCYLYEVIPGHDDPETEAVDNVQRQQLKMVLWGAVEELPDKQPDIIKTRYQKGLTMKAVGECHGMSKDEVRTIHDKAILRLRLSKRSRVLKSFMNDIIIDTDARKGTGVETFNRSWTSATERVALKI